MATNPIDVGKAIQGLNLTEALKALKDKSDVELALIAQAFASGSPKGTEDLLATIELVEKAMLESDVMNDLKKL